MGPKTRPFRNGLLDSRQRRRCERKSPFERSDPTGCSGRNSRRANTFVFGWFVPRVYLLFRGAYSGEKAAVRAHHVALQPKRASIFGGAVWRGAARRGASGGTMPRLHLFTGRSWGNVNNYLSATSRWNKSATDDTQHDFHLNSQQLHHHDPSLSFHNNINRYFLWRQSTKRNKAQNDLHVLNVLLFPAIAIAFILCWLPCL